MSKYVNAWSITFLACWGWAVVAVFVPELGTLASPQYAAAAGLVAARQWLARVRTRTLAALPPATVTVPTAVDQDKTPVDDPRG